MTKLSESAIVTPSSNVKSFRSQHYEICNRKSRRRPKKQESKTRMFVQTVLLTVLAIHSSAPFPVGVHAGTTEHHSNHNNEYGISEYQWEVGDSAALPCNITNLRDWRHDNKHISLLVWYRVGFESAPIFSLDTRSIPFVNAVRNGLKKATIAESLRDRVRMDFDVSPPVLHIDSVGADDAGDYRCRVDYRSDRSQYFLARLNVSVPPSEVIIRDLIGSSVSGMTGKPYNEGDQVSLFCDAIGGSPPPVVVWRSDGKILDDTYELVRANVTRNELSLPRIDRSNLLQELTCEAYAPKKNNTVPRRPSSVRRSSVVLDLNLKPLLVRIVLPGDNSSRRMTVSAGRPVDVECRTLGSRPPAEITWWKGSRRLPTASARSHYTSSSVDDSNNATPNVNSNPNSLVNTPGVDATNLTVSILSYTPAVEDDGQKLTCRADNLQITNEELEDSVLISVQYPPQISLTLGAKIPETIREGSDVYFECIMRSNPPLKEVIWLFDGRPLSHDPAFGVLVNNQSLVMQRVRREHRGFYQCLASNSEGESVSNKIFLNVQFAPVCKPGQTLIYGVARTEQVIIPCLVEAEPPTPINFRWYFNNTFESFELSKSNFTVELLNSLNTNSALNGEKGKTLYGAFAKGAFLNPPGTSSSSSSGSSSSSSSSFGSDSLESLLKSISTLSLNGPSVVRSNASYAPRTKLGYGTLFCVAENSIGPQRDPCNFAIVEAGPPHSVHDCLIVNVTMTSFVLKCMAGENGGLRQIFHLEVYNIEKNHLQVNVTSIDSAVFHVENLPPNTAFTLNIFSSNVKGRSDSVTMRTSTTAYAAKHTTNGPHSLKDMYDLMLSPMFGALLGAAISMLILCGTVVCFVRHRVCTSRRTITSKESHSTVNTEPDTDNHEMKNYQPLQPMEDFMPRPPPPQSTFYRLEPPVSSSGVPFLTEVLDPNNYYHQSFVPTGSEMMTNAFTYNINSDLFHIGQPTTSSVNTQNVTQSHSHSIVSHNHFPHPPAEAYTDYTDGVSQSQPSRVAALPLSIQDNLSSSTSDRTVEVDEEWQLPKHMSMNHTIRTMNIPQSQNYFASQSNAPSSPNHRVKFVEPDGSDKPLSPSKMTTSV